MPDYAEYGDLIHVWSAAPEGVHWAWKARFEDAKGLEGGNRSEAALRDLVTKASEAEKDDWRIIRQHIENIFEMGYELSDEDIDTLLPLAFGRILGIGPPEGLVTRIWADYLRRLAMKVNMEAASCIKGILYDLRSPSFADYGDVEQDLKGLHDIVQARAPPGWLGKWGEFINEDLYSADD